MKQLTCIICPRGCQLTIDDNLNVTGNFCKRGQIYALEELTNPSRTLTTTIRVRNRKDVLIPVRTNKKVPKDKLFDIMQIINKTTILAPCHINDVAIKNVLNLGVDIIFTSEIK